ncbi:hypothetical protein RRG08_018324 [Elysia crispata]|uniref:Uncharacterized protein n=1 Tax=Elysia crispata TaxID=231223 RepID=A0AAE1B005_9GAST|nr:hypothetical protein RRG08_018324 [Elysia crispata]
MTISRLSRCWARSQILLPLVLDWVESRRRRVFGGLRVEQLARSRSVERFTPSRRLGLCMWKAGTMMAVGEMHPHTPRYNNGFMNSSPAPSFHHNAFGNGTISSSSNNGSSSNNSGSSITSNNFLTNYEGKSSFTLRPSVTSPDPCWLEPAVSKVIGLKGQGATIQRD